MPTRVDSGAPSHGLSDASNTFTFAVTLSANSEVLIVFPGWVDSTSQSVSGITADGQAMTQIPGASILNDATAASRGHLGAGGWYLLNPPTGSPINIVITMNGGQPTRMMPGWATYEDVNSSGLFGTVVTGTDEATGTSFSLVPGSATGDLVIGAMVASSNAATDITPAGTQIFEVNEQSTFGTGHCAQEVAHSAGSSTTLTWTKGATRQAAGWAVALKAPSAGPDYELAADAGAVTVSGTAATLRAARRLSAEAGAYTVAGTAAGLAANRLLAAAAGAVTISGTEATLSKGRRLAADAGTVEITGTAATLRATRRLDAEPGSVQIAGTDATLAVRQPGQATGGKATRYEWADLDELLARRQRLLRQDGKVRPFSERDLYGRLSAWQPEAQRAAGRPFEDASEFVQLKASGVAAATARAHEEQEAYAQWTGRRGVMRYADLAAFLDRIGDSK